MIVCPVPPPPPIGRRKTVADHRADGIAIERARVLALFYRNAAAVQSLVAARKLDEGAAKLLCMRLDAMREQIEAGLHVPDIQGEQQHG